ncbi:MAG: hypothetical protein ACTSYL_03785 [Candidatus Thorarchaeota archaeon]
MPTAVGGRTLGILPKNVQLTITGVRYRTDRWRYDIDKTNVIPQEHNFVARKCWDYHNLKC